MYVRIYYFGGLHNGKVHLNEQNGLWYELQGDYYSLFGVAHRKKKNVISTEGISVSIKRCSTPIF